jgi:hypothetical protein
MMAVRLDENQIGINSDKKFGEDDKMKLNKLILGILAAVATFIFGISAFAVLSFGLSLLPKLSEKTEADERISIPEPGTVAVEPVLETSEGDEETPINQEEEDFNRTEYYYLYADDETLPKAFADIEHLSIETHEYNEKAGENGPYWIPIVPKGSIQTKKAFKFERVAVGTRLFSFQTATVDGISYKFIGSFPDTKAGSDSHSGGPDIEGRLIKIKDNKWAAEMEAKFYVAGC